MILKTNTEFDTEEFSNAYPDGIETNFWNSARNRVIHNYIKKYNLDHILDIGCGRGIVTDYLSRRGVNITGVESGLTKPIGNDSKIYYQTDALELPESLRESFKSILLLDVIEHIEYPVSFLKNIMAGFSNVETFLITVPSRKELWSNYDTYYGHFRRYDPDMLQSELNEAGLEIIKMRYFFNSLYTTMRLKQVFEKERPVSFKAPASTMSKYFNRLVGSLMFYEILVIPGFLRGSSLICIAKKKTTLK